MEFVSEKEILENCTSFENTVEFIIEKMKKQNCQSNEGMSCKYRTYKKGEPISCPIGHIIPDSKYHSTLEGGLLGDFLEATKDINPVESELVEWWKKNLPWIEGNKDFFAYIQTVHDGSNWDGVFEERISEGEEWGKVFEDKIREMLKDIEKYNLK